MEGNLKSEVNQAIHFYENIDVFHMPGVLIYRIVKCQQTGLCSHWHFDIGFVKCEESNRGEPSLTRVGYLYSNEGGILSIISDGEVLTFLWNSWATSFFLREDI